MQTLNNESSALNPSFSVGVIVNSLKILSTESYALDHVIYCSIVCFMITDLYFLFSIWLLDQLSNPKLV